MYKRILVPLDGSAFAEEVIPVAARLAKQVGADLTFVRIVGSPADMVDAEAYIGDLAPVWSAEGLAAVTHGNISETIMGEADRIPHTLTAITARGRSGMGTAMLGSVARQYVQDSHDPVLVYRPRGKKGAEKAKRIRSVVLPLDGTARSESMIPQAVEWARALDAYLILVQVLEDTGMSGPYLDGTDLKEDFYLRGHADDIARTYGVRAEWDVLHGNPVHALAAYLTRRKNVMVVMATRTQPALRAAVLGSVTSGLMHRVSVPVVVQATGD